jgi:ribosomal protein S18 acetylase RimI-like enzyme
MADVRRRRRPAAPPPLVLREADRADAVLLARLIRRAFATVAARQGITRAAWPSFAAFTPASRVRELMDAGFRYVILEDGGRPVGCVCMRRLDPDPSLSPDTRGAAGWPVLARTVHVRHLAVLPEARGRGLGGRLLAHVVSRARRCRARRVTLGIVGPDKELQSWYARRGFQVLETASYNDLPCTVTWMVRNLGGTRA